MPPVLMLRKFPAAQDPGRKAGAPLVRPRLDPVSGGIGLRRNPAFYILWLAVPSSRPVTRFQASFTESLMSSHVDCPRCS